jgi:hypothetical protein
VVPLLGTTARRRRRGITQAESSDSAAALAAMIGETSGRPTDLLVTGLLVGMAFGLAARGRNNGPPPPADP